MNNQAETVISGSKHLNEQSVNKARYVSSVNL